jgi:hypothetical protein
MTWIMMLSLKFARSMFESRFEVWFCAAGPPGEVVLAALPVTPPTVLLPVDAAVLTLLVPAVPG